MQTARSNASRTVATEFQTLGRPSSSNTLPRFTRGDETRDETLIEAVGANGRLAPHYMLQARSPKQEHVPIRRKHIVPLTFDQVRLP